MSVTMEQVRNQLDREEPNYAQAARLGPDALPHLLTLILGDNLGLAAKAASLAGSINDAQSAEVLQTAARHSDPAVRVAAAASLKSLTSIPSSLAIDLLSDTDAGVRKWMLKTLEVNCPTGIRTKVEEMIRSDPDLRLRDHAHRLIDRLQ